MNPSEIQIDFVGVRHYGRVRKLVRELENIVSEETDAIFIERSPERPSWRTKLHAFALNPSIYIFLYVYKYISIIFVLIKNRKIEAADELAARAVAKRYDIPIHDVDKSIHRAIIDQSWAWLFLSWVFFVFFFVEIYTAISVGPIAVVVAFLQTVLAILFLIGYPALLTTIADRNAVMLSRILRISSEHDYHSVCMVTGAMHLDKFGEYADEFGTAHELIEVEYMTGKIRNRIKRVVGKVRRRV